jgi:hypothetical protein
MTISEMLRYESLEDIRLIILQNEVEAFRRDSYIEQFETLETRFGLPLKKFERWPDFVEMSQRRNLLTHCDGVVSDQYIDMCRQEGYSQETDISVGDQLDIGAEYFFKSCSVMCEVGAKLGHTLWRKIFPTELEDADAHLNDLVYDQDKRERWEMAMMLGEFNNSLPRKSSEMNARIAVINYAIALKFDGNEQRAFDLLDDLDWSATSIDFKLAEAVLRDEHTRAAEIMNIIGKESELVKEHSYHIWPLFHKFRETQEFIDAYENVYGYPFLDKLESKAKEVEEMAEEEFEKRKEKLAENLRGNGLNARDTPVVEVPDEEKRDSDLSEEDA